MVTASMGMEPSYRLLSAWVQDGKGEDERSIGLSMKKISAVILALMLALSALPALASESDEVYKVIFDTDMLEMHDDVKCMLMLLNSDKIDVLGVTTSPGNSHTEEGMAYTLRMLELFGYDEVPVYPGAGVPLVHAFDRYENAEAFRALYGGFPYGIFAREKPESYLELAEEPSIGYPEYLEPQDMNAVEFIAKTVKENPGEITLIVVGACTNVALAIRTYPEIIPLVKQVIYMGGAFDVPGNMTPVAECNFWMDPEAAKICLNAPFARQVVVPLDACMSAFVDKAFYDKMCAAPKTPFLEMYEELEVQYYQDEDDKSPVFDEITAALLINPEVVTRTEKRYVDVDITYGETYGKSLGYAESSIVPAGLQEVEIVMEVDEELLWSIMYEYLTK